MAEEKSKEKFEMLLEDLKKDFKAAFDGLSALRDETRRGFEEVKEQIRFVDDKVGFLGNKVGFLENKMDAVHTSLKNEIKITALAAKDELKDDIKRVEDKLDVHMRMPAHAAV